MRRTVLGGARPLVAALLLFAALTIVGCEPAENREVPSPAALDSIFGEAVTASLDGNIVDLRVTQATDQLRRGGSIWAKAGPYIYLFTPQTRELFDGYGGIGGVRVTTVDPRGEMIATALLPRAALNSVTWRRAINVAGRARTEGTRRPQTMIDLADYGEERTEFEYSPEYVRSD